MESRSAVSDSPHRCQTLREDTHAFGGEGMGTDVSSHQPLQKNRLARSAASAWYQGTGAIPCATMESFRALRNVLAPGRFCLRRSARVTVVSLDCSGEEPRGTDNLSRQSSSHNSPSRIFRASIGFSEPPSPTISSIPWLSPRSPLWCPKSPWASGLDLWVPVQTARVIASKHNLPKGAMNEPEDRCTHLDTEHEPRSSIDL